MKRALYMELPGLGSAATEPFTGCLFTARLRRYVALTSRQCAIFAVSEHVECRTVSNAFVGILGSAEQRAGCRSLVSVEIARYSPMQSALGLAQALTGNAPVGLFDLSVEASQASRYGPEGKWREARVFDHF